MEQASNKGMASYQISKTCASIFCVIYGNQWSGATDDQHKFQYSSILTFVPRFLYRKNRGPGLHKIINDYCYIGFVYEYTGGYVL
jgi:hypothetical protein